MTIKKDEFNPKTTDASAIAKSLPIAIRKREPATSPNYGQVSQSLPNNGSVANYFNDLAKRNEIADKPARAKNSYQY